MLVEVAEAAAVVAIELKATESLVAVLQEPLNLT